MNTLQQHRDHEKLLLYYSCSYIVIAVVLLHIIQNWFRLDSIHMEKCA